jgi:hypothetical protein
METGDVGVLVHGERFGENNLKAIAIAGRHKQTGVNVKQD